MLGSCLGPLAGEAEVAAFVEAEDWIHVQRLEVVHKHLPFEGCVLDERTAYRQVLIRPAHKWHKSSVICLKDPADGRPKFFFMIGHSLAGVSGRQL